MSLFYDFFKKTTLLGLENSVRRFYGKYPGRVVTHKGDDRGLIKVMCPALGTSEPLGHWARPTSALAGPGYGFYSPPQIGDPVWLTFDHGDPRLPRYEGSWWEAPGVPGAATSYVPADFKTGGLPTTRGFISPAGHGWLIEDLAGRDPRLEIFTGTLPGPLLPVVKNHQIILSDLPAAPKVTVQSSSKQKLVMDVIGQSVTLTTPGGFKLVLNDALGTASLESPTTQKVEINDTAQTINVTGTGTVNVTGPTAVNVNSTGTVNVTGTTAVNINSTGAVLVNAGGAATVTAAGIATVQGAGVAINSTGAGATTMKGGGISTMEFTGKMTQTVNALSVISAAIKMGDETSALSLLTEAFLTLYNTHTHTGNLGAPTGPPLQTAVIGTHSTTKTKAS